MLTKEQLDSILARQIGWIAAADSRLALVVPISTAMFAALAAYAPAPREWSLSSGLPASLALLLLTLSIVCCAFACFPRTTGTNGSVIFFGGINEKTLPQYQATVAAMTDSQYQADLIEQCFVNAQIAATKFVWVKRGLASLFLATLPWGAAIYKFLGATHAVC